MSSSYPRDAHATPTPGGVDSAEESAATAAAAAPAAAPSPEAVESGAAGLEATIESPEVKQMEMFPSAAAGGVGAVQIEHPRPPLVAAEATCPPPPVDVDVDFEAAEKAGAVAVAVAAVGGAVEEAAAASATVSRRGGRGGGGGCGGPPVPVPVRAATTTTTTSGRGRGRGRGRARSVSGRGRDRVRPRSRIAISAPASSVGGGKDSSSEEGVARRLPKRARRSAAEGEEKDGERERGALRWPPDDDEGGGGGEEGDSDYEPGVGSSDSESDGETDGTGKETAEAEAAAAPSPPDGRSHDAEPSATTETPDDASAPVMGGGEAADDPERAGTPAPAPPSDDRVIRAARDRMMNHHPLAALYRETDREERLINARRTDTSRLQAAARRKLPPPPDSVDACRFFLDFLTTIDSCFDYERGPRMLRCRCLRDARESGELSLENGAVFMADMGRRPKKDRQTSFKERIRRAQEESDSRGQRWNKNCAAARYRLPIGISERGAGGAGAGDGNGGGTTTTTTAVRDVKLCPTSFRNLLRLTRKTFERLWNSARDDEPGPIRHKRVGNDIRYSRSDLSKCEHDLRNYLRVVGETLGVKKTVTANTVVDGGGGGGGGGTTTTATTTIVELPPSASKRNMYVNFCWQRGWVVQANANGKYPKMGDYGRRPADGMFWPEGAEQLPVCAWASFKQVWDRDFPFLKTWQRWPCRRDVGDEPLGPLKTTRERMMCEEDFAMEEQNERRNV